MLEDRRILQETATKYVQLVGSIIEGSGLESVVTANRELINGVIVGHIVTQQENLPEDKKDELATRLNAISSLWSPADSKNSEQSITMTRQIGIIRGVTGQEPFQYILSSLLDCSTAEEKDNFIKEHLHNPTPAQEQILRNLSKRPEQELAKYIKAAPLNELAEIAGNNDNTDLTKQILTRAKSLTTLWSRIKSWFSKDAATSYNKAKEIIKIVNDKKQHNQNMPPEIQAGKEEKTQNIAKIQEIDFHHIDSTTILKAGDIGKNLLLKSPRVVEHSSPLHKQETKEHNLDI